MGFRDRTENAILLRFLNHVEKNKIYQQVNFAVRAKHGIIYYKSVGCH